MKTRVIFIYTFCALIVLSSCGQSSEKKYEQMVSQPVSDSCDDPDAPMNCSFVNMPENLSNIMIIADAKEPGERLIISGRIFKADGKTPYANVILYAYQTDHTGLYTKKGNEKGFQKWHGHLHGWCKTGKDGYYEIHSIRPARYPDNSMPAHIHATIKTENGEIFNISDYVFKDDDLVDKKYLSTLINNVGGTGIVDIYKRKENTWTENRDIIIKR